MTKSTRTEGKQSNLLPNYNLDGLCVSRVHGLGHNAPPKGDRQDPLMIRKICSRTMAEEHHQTVENKELLALCASRPAPTDLTDRLSRLVLSGKVDVNCRDEDGMTPLLLLCQNNQSEQLLPCIRILLSSPNNHLDVNRTNSHGVNALLLLCRNYVREDLIRIIRLLAGAGINLNASTNHWNALLLLARYYPSQHGKLFDLAWLLIQGGIQLNFATPGGWRAIHFVCRYYSGPDLIDVINYMILYGADVNCRTTRHGYTPLLLLCQHNGDEKMLAGLFRKLVVSGADVGARTNGREWNVLHTLCRFHSRDHLIDLVRLVVEEYRVDVNIRTSDGSTALHFLCAHYANENLIDLVRFLVIQHGADVRCTTNDGWNALLLLCQHYSGSNLIDLVQLLIDHGVDVNYRDPNGWNVLLFLSQSSQLNESLIDIIRLLVQNGVDLNAKTKEGWNALLFLCRFYHQRNLIDVLALLIEHGIDLNCIDGDGWNAMTTLCRYYGEEDLIDLLRLLIERGNMDPDFRTNDGWSSLMILCRFYRRKNLPDIIRLLVRHGADLNAAANDGTTSVYLLAHNWSGQLHSVLEQFPPGSIRLLPKEDLLLKAAELGCVWTVLVLLQYQTEFNYVDSTGRDAFDRLEDVMKHSQSLCIRCKEIASTKNPKNNFLDAVISDRVASSPFRNVFRPLKMSHEPLRTHRGTMADNSLAISNLNYDRFKAACRERIQRCLLPPPSKRILFQNDRPLNDAVDIFRVDPMVSEITPPSHHQWRKLLREWKCPESSAKFLIPNIRCYLSKHSHRDGVACQTGRCEWCQVRRYVDEYLELLLEKIKELDPLFELEMFPYGSSAEKTNIFHADEFDRGVKLRYFRHLPSTDDPYRVVCTAAGNPALAGNLAKNEPVNSNGVLLHFNQLLNRAVDRIYSVHVFSPVVALKETCVSLQFLYRGTAEDKQEGPMVVSVDLTVLVQTEAQTLDFKTLPDWYRHRMSRWEEKEEYLVPYRRINRLQSWRLSYPTLSRDVLLRAGETVGLVYQLLKFLVILHHAEEERSTIPRQTSISSYALKTCLFKYTRIHPPPWDRRHVIRHAINVLRLFPTNSSKLMSFFIDDIAIFYISEKSRQAVSTILARLESARRQGHKIF